MDRIYPINVKVIEANPGFTIYDTNIHESSPWPFMTRYHRFSVVESGRPHDHPFELEIYIPRGGGGYVEEAFTVHDDGSWSSQFIERAAGSTFVLPATHIHRIVELKAIPVWTHVITGRWERDWRFWHLVEGEPASSVLWRDA
jgi:hypothetical protein